jgi:toxin YoeB
MAKGLVWTVEAQKDRQEIFEYWNNRNKSKQYSRKLNTIFIENLKLICMYPQLGIKTNIANVYKRTVKDYHFIYLELPSKIILLYIWDSRRNPELLNQKGIV